MKSLITGIFLLLTCASLKAQDQRLFELINEANEIAVSNPQQALDLVESALGLAYEKNNFRGEAYCHNTLGAIHYQLNQYKLSVDHYKKAVSIFEDIKDEQGRYNSFKYLGMAYDAMDSVYQALNIYEKFKNQAARSENEADVVNAKNRMARIFYNQGKFVESEKNYLDVLTWQLAQKDSAGMIDTYNHLGSVYTRLGIENKAINYFNLAEGLATSNEDANSLNQSLDNLSGFYRNQNDVSNELKTRKRALSYNSSKGYTQQAQTSNFQIGELYLLQNQCAAAIPYLKNSINLAEEIGILKVQGDLFQKENKDEIKVLQTKEQAYEALADAYEGLGKYDSALTVYKKSKIIADSVQNLKIKVLQDSQQLAEQLIARNEKINDLIREQELRAIKDKTERDAQNAKLKQQQIIIYSLLGGLLLLLVSGFFIFRSYQGRRKANQLLMLKSLRSQMNPHFIFNSLNSINSFIARHDERAANKYLSEFSRLMRTVLENSQEDFVPLATEVDVIRRYLNLEHFRFDDKFDFEFKIDPAIPIESIEIPPMLVQPYIENAIWHGLRYKEEKGFLKVGFNQLDGVLQVLIEDNGIGRLRSQELKTKHQQKQSSTGLRNTAERLSIINSLYQKELTVAITDLYPDQKETGTHVEIRIPI